MALLVGDNSAAYATNRGLTSGVARYLVAGHVAVASGTATSAWIRFIDWAESGASAKIIVFDSGGTQLAISDAFAVPIVLGFASGAFSSPPAIVLGQTYFLAVIVSTGQVDWYHDANTFLGQDCGGTYSFASPGGATLAGTTANVGNGAIYLDGTAASAGVSWMPSYQQSGRPKVLVIESGMKPSGT